MNEEKWIVFAVVGFLAITLLFLWANDWHPECLLVHCVRVLP